jgi:hypothetical protein
MQFAENFFLEPISYSGREPPPVPAQVEPTDTPDLIKEIARNNDSIEVSENTFAPTGGSARRLR